MLRSPSALISATIAGIGAGLLFALFFALAVFIYKQHALGFGDILLAVLIGTMTGIHSLIPALLLGMFLAAAGGLLLIAIGVRTRRDYIPYGAYLCAERCSSSSSCGKTKQHLAQRRRGRRDRLPEPRWRISSPFPCCSIAGQGGRGPARGHPSLRLSMTEAFAPLREKVVFPSFGGFLATARTRWNSAVKAWASSVLWTMSRFSSLLLVGVVAEVERAEDDRLIVDDDDLVVH